MIEDRLSLNPAEHLRVLVAIVRDPQADQLAGKI